MKELKNESITSKLEFKAIFKVIPMPIYLWQKVKNDLILIDYNIASEKITKGKIKNFVGINASELYKDKLEILEELDRCFNQKIKISREMDYTFNSIGEKKNLLVTYNFVLPDLVLVYTEDITERKEAEQKILESKQLLQIVVDNLPQHVFWKDRDSVFLGCNKKQAIVAGVSVPENIIGKTDYDLAWKKKEADFFRECDRRVMDTGTPEYHIIEPQRGANGKQTWLDTNKIPLHDSDGNVMGILGTYEDITERVLAEQELKKSEKKLKQKFKISEEKYRHLFEYSPYSIFLLNMNGTIVDFNSITEKLFGYKKSDLLNKKFIEIKELPSELLILFKNKFALLIKGETPEPIEFKVHDKNNNLVWLILQSSLIKSGNENYIQVILQDITERKKAEQKLKESEEKYRLIVENANDMIYIFNDKFEFDYVNEQAFMKYLGYSKDDLLGRSAIILIHPEDIKRGIKALRKGFKTGQAYTELRIRDKNGTYHWHNITGNIFLDINEKKKALLIGRDVSERKKTEQKLKESEEKFRKIAEQSLMGIIIAQDNEIKYVNKTYADILGYTVEEMKKWGLEDVVKAIHPDDLEFVMKQLSKKQKGDQDVKVHYQYRGIKKNGEIIWVDNYSKPMNFQGRSADLVTIIDITERKEAEQKIKESEKKYRDLANSLPQVICETDKRGNLIFINQNAFKVFGYTQDDFNKGLKALQMLVPEDRKRARGNIARVLRRENVGYNEYTALRKDGSMFPVSIYASPIIRKNQSVGMRSIIIDITERKEAEQKLKESEHNLSERVKELSCLYGLSTLVEDSDMSYEEILQGTLDLIPPGWQFPDVTCARIVYEEKEFKSKNYFKSKWKQSSNIFVNKEQVAVIEVYYLEEKLDPDEEPFLKEETALINALAERLGRIKERMNAEQKLKESEKNSREAYDRANFYKDLFTHDINNILNNIQSSIMISTLYLHDPKKLNDLKDFYNIIKDQVDRGIKLVSVVRKLFDLEEIELFTKSMDLYKLIKDSKEFVIKSFPEKKVNIKIDALSKKLLVQANELLLDVLENILINAVKYNDNPDVNITIKISKKESKGKKYLKIEFMDNGIGVEDASKELIFQKGHEEHKGVKGMGLGLSLVKKIIDKYEGQIWVEDIIKGDHTRGSNFIILIPEAEKI